jgi:hypothetical protein
MTMRNKVMKKAALMGICLAVFCVWFICDCGLSSAEPKPGDVYDKSNWQEVAEYVAPAIVEMLKTQGLVIHVGPSKDYPLSKAYLEATEKYKGTVKVDKDGSLINFKAGQPFVDIDIENDPDAAIKLAWNMEVRSQPEQRYYHKFNFVWINKNGEIERTATGRDRKLYYVGRVVNEPKPIIPNDEGFNYKEILSFYDPKDVAGTGFVVWKYLAAFKDEDAWAYVPALRRVRRMTSGMITDAYLGSDITIEDFDGFSGKPPEYNWKLVGKKKMLFIRDTEKQYLNYRGGIGWCPENVFWQLRPVYILEATSKKKWHPYSKRLIYVDVQHHNIAYTEMFDRQGKFWKLWIRSEFYHKDWNWFTCAGESVIDFQAMHATLVGAYCKPQNPGYTERMFTMDELERLGH